MEEDIPDRLLRIEYELRTLPRRDTPIGHQWMVDRMLGEGGNGRAWLWNLVRRRDQVIVDRVVIKQTEVGVNDFITTQGPGHGEIGEVFIHRSMVTDGEDAGDIYTVPLLAAEHCSWAMDAWRFYSPYYSFGDLHGLIRKQGKENSADPTQGHRQIPEPFVWYLLHRLSAAAVIMDQSLTTPDRDYQVVHCDFKPANLFMGAPGSLGRNRSFPIYPPVYVGDFGNARITYTGDPWHFQMVGGCTTGWAAPEITPFTDNRMPKEWQAPASSKTNVWQIGWTLLSIMQGKVYHEDDVDWDTMKSIEYAPSYKPMSERTPELEADNPIRVEYSQELLDTLHACVKFAPSKRPTPQRLHAFVSDIAQDHTEGMETWGTYDWFEDKNEEIDPDSEEDEIDEHGRTIPRQEPKKGHAKEMINIFKRLLHLPGAPKKSNGRVGRSGRTPIIREESPLTRMGRRRRDYNRRKQIVSRQIRKGLEPKLTRYVSTEPSDDVFNLADKYKLIHPDGNHLLNDYWIEPGPAKTSFTPYIDDLNKYFDERNTLQQAYPDHDVPFTGPGTYDFRLAGEERGETYTAEDDEEYEQLLAAVAARTRAQESSDES